MDENITNSEAVFQATSSPNPSIDELQKLILAKMEADEALPNEDFEDFESAEEFPSDVVEEIDETSLDDAFSSLENEYYDISPDEKKYVVAINPDLVPFFDKMHPERRTGLINQLLFAHIESQRKISDDERIKKFLKHSAVVVLTVIVGFPSVFFMTNASIEATLNSYRQIQGNFEKLYQEKGGVKRKDMTKMQNLQY